MVSNLKKEILMKLMTWNLASFTRTRDDALNGMVGVHVDDSIRIVCNTFIKESLSTSE